MNANNIISKPRLHVSRNAAIVLAVVGLHVGFVAALQSGLLMRAAEVIVPVELLSQIIEPQAPKLAPPPVPLAAPASPPAQTKPAIAKAPSLAAPLPAAIADPSPAPNAPTGTTAPQPTAATAPAPISEPVAAAPAAPAAAPTAQLTVQLPSSNADYLQNPSPPYPAISRRLNEQGKTILRVLIGADGQPQRAEVGKSSGFDRLDQAAVTAVLRWRFVPGKRGGVAEAMWFNLPINWELTQ